ncbi:MAG: N-acetylmuramoyl-L-alanine amidase [Chlamydiales bacterium]|nr:N-acetylmuramoyl-L-alanine amidase [Chlamydiales bacterium]
MKILALFFLPLSLCAFDFHDFDRYQNHYTAEEIRGKLEKYLEKDPSIREFYQLTPKALSIGKKGSPDYVLTLRDDPLAGSFGKQRKRSLKGLRVALDPGHLGGEYAELEKRCIKVLGIHLHEGDMAYLTALKLKELLEKEGARVMITRPGFGEGALGESFKTWETKQKPASEKTKFIRYNREDLYARAEKINAFHPDLTLILHYNSEYSEEDETIPLIDENYAVVFIPGAFSDHELDRERDRYEFLRLLVTETMEQSFKLSRKVAERFAKDLGVPLIDHAKLSPKLEPYSLLLERGVYARNLILTRLIQSPVCYGEPLLQNHRKEAERLSVNDGEIQGVRCSKRLEEVARAYFEGIKAYCLGG